MLLKSKRLSKKEFDEVFEKGSGFKTDNFSTKFLRNKDTTKTSVVISKKKLPLSSDRISVRRKVYGALEKIWTDIPKGTWMIFFVQNKKLPSADVLYKEVGSVFKKLS
jgi:ribonuclease P protein component